MATNYPGSLDTSSEQPSPLSTTEMDDAGFEHDVVHTNHSGAIIALETKVGTGSSTAVADSVLAGTGSGTSAWSTSPTLSGHVTAESGGADGGIVIGQAFSSSYVGVRTAGMAETSTEYNLITNGTHTFLSAGTDGDVYIRGGGNSTAVQMWMDTSATTTHFNGDVNFDSGTLFVDVSSNNVGIGDTTPENALHVYRTGYSPSVNDDAALRVEGNWGGGIVMSEGSARMGIYAPGGNQFQVRTGQTASGGGTIGLSQDASGNVGIKDTTPSYTLDVNGTGRFTSNLTAEGDLYVGKNGGSDSRMYFYDDNSNAWRLFMWDDSQNSFYTDQTIRSAQLLWTTTDDGLGPVTGQYGSVQTRGTGVGNWEGYSINGQQVFMGNGTETCGIYNDVDNQWLIYFDADTHTRLYDSDGIVAFGANNATTSGGGSGGNGYCGISNECGGFSGTTAVVSTTTVAGVTMKRIGFSSSSYEYKTGIEDFNLSDEAFMSLRPITFHPNAQYVDSTGDVTEIAGGHTIVPDDDEAGETAGLIPLRRAGFGLEDLYAREDTMILASEYSPDPNALIALLTKKLQETMTRVAALEAA